ncbi:hypothetical protein K9U40_19585 [Xanthobacter autotrophicus]|uniref:hypothetical protein n=1 Tax=Xanthobacter TaxID=279 RepID=UPI0024AC05C4|nr:hypothetical protein [Xanthobacter autotrophicus]MDI4666510.1 hypothetical protein [Xanthobacter autotrophicus]
MRLGRAFVRRSLLLLSLALSVGACSHVPVASLPQLASLDLDTADLSVLRAAVRAPKEIVAVPGGAFVIMSYWRPGEEGRKTTVQASLEVEADPKALAALKEEEHEGQRITVFRLTDEGRRKLEAARSEMLALKSDELAKGRRLHGSLAVSAEGCVRGMLPSGPLPLSTYLRLKPGGNFVPLIQGVDLRTLLAQAGSDETVMKACAG